MAYTYGLGEITSLESQEDNSEMESEKGIKSEIGRKKRKQTPKGGKKGTGSTKRQKKSQGKLRVRGIKQKGKEKKIRTTRLIVGVDFGTTYTGVSHVLSTDTLESVETIMHWPKTWDRREKIPTTIALKGDGDNTSTSWGTEVKPGMLAASWFKIGMAPIACATPEDDPLLQQAVGKGLMRTPKGHTSYSLCEEFLACLYPHIMDAVKRHHSSAIDETPIEFVFSAPAEWGDEYKAKLRNAATAAGFATRMGDKISMIDEPEAAALLTFECYKKSTQIDSVFKVNKNVMVVDMGGGTVDIITYRIQSTSPFKFTEVHDGCSAMCGGTTIDRELHDLLGRKYGKHFAAKSIREISQGSEFMREFEDIKSRFDGSSGNQTLSLWMDRESGNGYDADLGVITITNDELSHMFDRVIEPSFEKVSQQILQSAKENREPVKALVLCGGLAGNSYIRKRFQEFCSEKLRTARVMVPSRSWSAIATGAALCKIEKRVIIGARKCRWSYGISQHRLFVEGKDDERNAFICPARNEKRAGGYVVWHIKRGATIPRTYKWLNGYVVLNTRGPLVHQIKLYKCKDEKPPETIGEDTQLLGTLRLDFSKQMKRTGSPNSEERMVKIGHRIKTDSGRVEFVARIGGRKPLACSSFEYEDIEEVTKDEAEDSLWADQESQMEEEEDEEVESEHEDGEDDDDEDVEVNGAAGW